MGARGMRAIRRAVQTVTRRRPSSGFHRCMQHTINVAGYRANLVRSIPLVLAVPVVLGVVCLAAGVPVQPIAVAGGALGWLVALVLRRPVAAAGLWAAGGR